MLRLPKRFFTMTSKHEASASTTTTVHPTAHSILSQPLVQHSLTPIPTGILRDGFCHSPSAAQDPGNHTIAGIVSEEFLDFSAQHGNDLRSVGLKGGCRWCLCVSRWWEALDAYRKGEVGRETVPRIVVEATGRRAEEWRGSTGGVVGVGVLREWEAARGKA